MANKRLDQLNTKTTPLNGEEFTIVFNTTNSKTEKIKIETLSEFIGSSGAPLNKLFDNGNSTTNLTLDLSKGNIQKINLVGDTNIEFINGVSGGTYQILFNQEDITRYKINWPQTILWSGGEEKLIQKIGEVKLNTEFTQNIGDGFNDYVYALGVQSDNKIIVGGEFNEIDGIEKKSICRLTESGDIDPTFLIGEGFSQGWSVFDLDITNNDEILVGGDVFILDANQTPKNLIKLNSDGTVDNNFNFDTNVGWFDLDNLTGRTYLSFRNSFNGGVGRKIVGSELIMKVTSTNEYHKVKFTQWTDGGNGGGFSYERQLVYPTMGSIISFTKSDYGNEVDVIIPGVLEITRGNQQGIYNSATEGSFNSSVSPSGTQWNTPYRTLNGFNNTVYAVKNQNDDKVLVGGWFSTYNDSSVPNRFCRLNQDGSVDQDFNNNLGGGFNNEVRSIGLLSGGEIIVGGSFSEFSGFSVNRIIKFNEDGTLDNNFLNNMGNGFNNTVSVIKIQPNGKILVGGRFTSFNGVRSVRVARLNPNGTLDTDFSNNIGMGANDDVEGIGVLENGKILIGGDFGRFNGQNYKKLVLLNEDGTIDGSFTVGSGFNREVEVVKIIDNNTFITGGEFTDFRNISSRYIAKLGFDVNPGSDIFDLTYDGINYIISKR